MPARLCVPAQLAGEVLPTRYGHGPLYQIARAAERFGRWPWELEACSAGQIQAVLAYDAIRCEEERRMALALAGR